MLLVATRPGVSQFSGLITRSRYQRCGVCGDSARAVAPIHEALGLQDLERFEIAAVAIALTAVAFPRPVCIRRMNVWTVSKPIQIVENAAFKLGARSNAIVILDTEKHAPTERGSVPPDKLRIEDVAEMQPTGGRGRETRKHVIDPGL